MAVGFVASASSGSQASVASFSIGTLGTGARAGIVFVCTHNSSTAVDTGVTWNGVSMTLLYSATDTDTEPGVTRAYFLDNVSNGTITVSRTNNATVCVGYAASISATGVAEIAQVITRVSSTQNTNANTSTTGTGASGEVAVDTGSLGTNAMRFAAAYTGAATPVGAGTNSTSLQSLDSTAFGSSFVRETTAGTGSRNVGFATGTTDDWAMVAVGVRELQALLVPSVASLTLTTFAPVIATTIVGASPTALTITSYAPVIGLGIVVPLYSRYEAIVRRDGPNAYWRFGESAGTSARDEIGTATGTYVGSPTLGATGAISGDANKAVTLSGSGQYITVASQSAIHPGDTLSLEIWVKRTATGTFDYLLWGGVGDYLLYVSDTDHIVFAKADTATIFLASGFWLDTGSYHHIVVTKNGSTFHLYYDGAEPAGTFTNATLASASTTVGIGAFTDGFAATAGSIDEVAIYPTALTAAQVTEHYLVGTNGPSGLALTTFAPTVSTTNNTRVDGASPTALTLTTFAPVIALVITGASPTALALTTFAPVLQHSIIGASPSSLALSTFAPAVTTSDNKTVTPDVTALTTATLAPTLALVIVGASPTSLTLTTFAPTITLSDNRLVTPFTARLYVGRRRYAEIITADAPSAYWRLGESSGTAADDAIGSNDGVYQGSPTLGVTGALTGDVDTAVSLNGTSQFVTVASSTALHPGDTLSLEIWVKRSATGSFDYLLWGGVGDYHLYISDTDHLVFAKADTATIFLVSDFWFDTGSWHHVVVTKDGSDVHVYYDSNEAPGTLTNATLVASTDDIGIGAFTGGFAYTHGALDEVAIYDHALTAAQVVAHYEAAVAGPGTFAPTIVVSAGQTAIPDTASLTLATFAPVVTTSANQLVTPDTTALTLTTFAPTVTASDHKTVTPDTTTLTTATFAPVIALAAIPGTASLTTSTFAPSIVAGTVVTPGVASLTLTTFAPTVSTPVTVTPDTAALTLTTFAPSLSTPVTATPSTASLTITTFAPVIALSVIPSTASLTLTTFAPVIQSVIVVPATSLTTSTFAPTVTASDDQTATPSTGSLTLTTFAATVLAPRLVTPTPALLSLGGIFDPETFDPETFGGTYPPVVTATTNVLAVPDTASLVVTGYSPSVTSGDNREAVPATATLTLTTFAPDVAATAHQTFTPDTASLTLATFAPTVSTPRLATPTTASLTLTTFGANVGNPVQVIPDTASLSLTTFAPTVSMTANVIVTPDTATLALTRFAPDVAATAHQTVVPGLRALGLSTFVPTVFASDYRLVTPDLASLTLATLAPTVSTAPAIPPLPRHSYATITIPSRPRATVVVPDVGNEGDLVLAGPIAEVE